MDLYSKIFSEKHTVFQVCSYLIGVYLAIKLAQVLLGLPKRIAASIHHKKLLAQAKVYRTKTLEKLQKARELLPKLTLSAELQEEILQADVTKLLTMLDSKKVTSVELLTFYYDRCLKLNPEYNFLTDENIEEALKLAKQCDEDRKKNSPRAKGLLFGIPVSIKEAFGQKGLDRTGGCIEYINKPFGTDSLPVAFLKAEGAIPFVRTNLPQVMYTLVSTNRIHGDTANPWNKSRSSGGSTGGEGSIIACRASPLGIGSDIGGSIRIPSHFCGLYGFKPTGGRISVAGHAEFGPTGLGQINILSVCGPIGRSVNDLELMTRALHSDKIHSNNETGLTDFNIPNIPWNHDLTFHKEGTKLTFGYFETLDIVRASQPVRRAVRETIQRLKQAGHTVVEFDVSFSTQAVLNQLRIITADDFKLAFDMLGKEAPIEAYKTTALMTIFSPCVKKSLGKLCKLLGQTGLSDQLNYVGRCSVVEYLEASHSQTQLKKQFCEQFQKLKLDALIAPGFATPAVQTKHADEIIITGAYTALWNFLCCPAGAVPVTRVQPGEDIYEEKSGKVPQVIDKVIAADMKGSVGMPIGIQVVTPPWQDEKCIAAMRVIEKLVPFYKENSFPVQLDSSQPYLRTTQLC